MSSYTFFSQSVNVGPTTTRTVVPLRLPKSSSCLLSLELLGGLVVLSESPPPPPSVVEVFEPSSLVAVVWSMGFKISLSVVAGLSV